MNKKKEVSNLNVLSLQFGILMKEKYAFFIFWDLKITKGKFPQDIFTEQFNKFEKFSFDYGALERSEETIVLQSTIPWDDIGDFNAVARILKLDSEKNFFKGQVQ